MSNNDLVIVKVDRGNAIVVMSKLDCVSKILGLLSDTINYKILMHNPWSKILRKVKLVVSSSSFDTKTKKCLLPSKEVTPSIPFRPIVDIIASPTYKLASYLAKLINPLIGQSESIKDSTHFVDFIKDKRLEDHDLLVSFDVVTLFTRVPILDALRLLRDNLMMMLPPLSSFA